MFQGVYTALLTPFQHDGALDLPALTALVERQVAGGVDGVVPCGTTGEASTLSAAERVQVIRTTVAAAAGRVKVIAGVGGNDTRAVAEAARGVVDLGVDGALVVTPYYNKPSQEGLYQHYRAVTEAAPGLPVVAYNVPSRTGVSLTVDTLSRLADLPGIVAVKEATADMVFGGELLARTHGRLTVLSGDDFTALPLWSLGGRGVISVTSNLFPERFVALWRAFEAGDAALAATLQRALYPIFKAMFIEVNPVPLKAMVAWHTGLCTETLRLPLVNLLPENAARLQALAAELGIALPHAPSGR